MAILEFVAKEKYVNQNSIISCLHDLESHLLKLQID